MAEQIRLINECRTSGLSDVEWCSQHDIAVSTFYNWITRCRKKAADQVPAPGYGRVKVEQPAPDIVPVQIIPEEIHDCRARSDRYLDNSHTIEISMGTAIIRISNDADPALLSRTIRILGELSC